jgi:inactivated superfamily I helicase
MRAQSRRLNARCCAARAHAAGSAGLKHALTTFLQTRNNLHPRDPRNFVLPADLAAAEHLVERLARALAPLEDLSHGSQSLFALAQAHASAIEELADSGKIVAAYAGTDGRQLQRAFEIIAESPSSRTLELGRLRLSRCFSSTRVWPRGAPCRNRQSACTDLWPARSTSAKRRPARARRIE